MAETILYRNFRKFADYIKKNQSKNLNNRRDIEFTKLKLFCFKNRKENTEKNRSDRCYASGCYWARGCAIRR